MYIKYNQIKNLLYAQKILDKIYLQKKGRQNTTG